jgi:predicted nucleotide-binding protein (sugar kinase/HSP70/actin superfamily)
MKDTSNAYEDMIDAQLKEWSAQIALLTLKFKADRTKAEVKIDYYKIIDAVQRKQEEARTKLQELKTAGDEAWEDVKKGAEKAWSEVKTVYHDAKSRFK